MQHRDTDTGTKAAQIYMEDGDEFRPEAKYLTVELSF